MVKISTNIKNFIETITKKLFYTKTETDTKLNNKANKTTATTSANGLMSKEDKSKLNGIATEANKTVVDSSLSSSSTNPVQNKVVNSALNGKANSSHNHSISNITKLQSTLDSKSATGHTHDDRYYTATEMNTKLNGKADSSHSHSISNITNLQSALDNKSETGHTHDVVTQSNNGFLSKEDKVKLDGIAEGANKTVVDSALSSSSTNPVQNKVVNSALNGKSNTGHEHTSDEIHYAYDQNVSVTTILENKAPKHHTHDDRYYTETEMDTKLNGKANSSHTHNISDVTGLSTSLDGKMSNDYSESTIESNFFAHKIGNIVIVTWWGGTLPTTQRSWVDWKTLPYESCNTQPIWVNGDGVGCEVRVRVPPNSNKLQVFIDGGTGTIRPGMIVYPTK